MKDKNIEEQKEQLAAMNNELKEKDAEMQKNAPAPDSVNIQQQMAVLDSMAGALEQHNQEMLESKRKESAGKESMTQSTAPAKPIDEKRIGELRTIYQKYKEGKQSYDRRIIENDELWRMRDFGTKPTEEGKKTVRPSAWLFNSLVNKHADYMDNFPEVICLPQEESDKQIAETLTKIIPCILASNKYEQVYSDTRWSDLQGGASCKGVFWDNGKLNGLGDIAIKEISLLDIAWKPGVKNIQESPYFFNKNIVSNDELISAYAKNVNDLKSRLSSTVSQEEAHFAHDETITYENCSTVIDCFYKIRRNGRTIVHLIKFVNDILLYASENDENCQEGYYNHGLYPFVVNKVFPIKDSPVGFGYADAMKYDYATIDEIDAAMVANIKRAAKNRYVVNKSAGISVDALTNFENDVIEASTNQLDNGNFREITTRPIGGIFTTFRAEKIEELKATSNNREFSNGGTANGITAASAIAALQEAGSKTSRDEIKAEYRSFEEEVYLIIELIRQFYDESRIFRITGKDGSMEFVKFSNENIKPKKEGDRIPYFDIKIKPQKNSPYSRAAQNELMLKLFQMGVFNPQLADQAILLLKNLEFEGKEELLQKVAQNGNLFSMVQSYQNAIMQMAKKIDAMQGGDEFTRAAVMAIEANHPEGLPAMVGSISNTSLGSEPLSGNSIVNRAKNNTRSATEVR